MPSEANESNCLGSKQQGLFQNGLAHRSSVYTRSILELPLMLWLAWPEYRSVLLRPLNYSTVVFHYRDNDNGTWLCSILLSSSFSVSISIRNTTTPTNQPAEKAETPWLLPAGRPVSRKSSSWWCQPWRYEAINATVLKNHVFQSTKSNACNLQNWPRGFRANLTLALQTLQLSIQQPCGTSTFYMAFV